MIALNAAAQLVSLGGILVVQTAYLILAARFLGVEDFGRFSLVFSISQILLIGGDLGLHNTAIRKISFQPDRSEVVFPLFFSMKAVVSALLAGAAGVVALALRETGETRVTLALFGIGVLLHSMTLAINIAFQAHGKLYFASLNSFLLILVQAAAGALALWLGGRLIWLGVTYVAAAGLALLVNWRLYAARVHPVRLGSLDGWRTFLRESIPVGAGAFFEAVSSRIVFSLLAWLAGSYATGIYSASARITGALRNLPVAVFGAVLPAMARHRDHGPEVRRLLLTYLGLLLAGILPIAAVLSVCADPIVGLLYGEQYREAADVLRILAWSLPPVCAGVALQTVMMSQPGLFRRYPLVAGSAMAINVAANLAMIPRLGSSGAAWALLLTESAAALLYAAAVWRFLQQSRAAAAGS